VGDGSHPHRGLHHEDPAVPVVLAAGHVALSGLPVRLLDELFQRTRALARRKHGTGANVAVSRFCAVGHDAEGHERAASCRGRTHGDRVLKSAQITDDVVRRHHEQNGVPLLRCGERGQRERRRGIASHGLEHDLRRTHPDLAQLLGDDEAILLVRDHERARVDLGCGKAPQPRRGLLEQRTLTGERQQLFGIALARSRPQSGSRAPGENHALDGHGVLCAVPSVSSGMPSRHAGFPPRDLLQHAGHAIAPVGQLEAEAAAQQRGVQARVERPLGSGGVVARTDRDDLTHLE